MSTRFIVSSDVCSASDKDGTTILSVERGVLYSAIGVASQIWNRLAAQPEGLTLEEMVGSIITDFPDLANDQIRLDVEHLLQQLTNKGLVESGGSKGKQSGAGAWSWFQIIVRFLARLSTKTILNLRLNALAAFLQLLFFDLTLKLGGFRALRNTVKRWPVAARKASSVRTIQQIDKCLNRAARWYPKHALCLQRSAALTCLLRGCGVPAQIVIACRRVPFKGHAWVEVNGEVVNDSKRVQTVCVSVLERC